MSNSEVMSVLEFGDELRRVGRYSARPSSANPLSQVVQMIKDNPAFAQSRLMLRVLTALAYQRGEFRRPEASALDSVTLSLAIQLFNAAGAGSIPQADWVNAVTATEMAA